MTLHVVNNISYSALSDFQHCPWYYKLVNVERKKKFESTNFTYWGSLLHKYIQLVLLADSEAQEYTLANRLSRTWSKYCAIHKQPDVKGWSTPGTTIIETARTLFKEVFGKYKVLKVEERLSLPSGDPFPQIFKGFIDFVIELEDGKIVIIDFKTCDNTWKFTKYSNKFKEYQLTLYKHFYSIKHRIDPKDIETYFVTMERTERSKKPLQFIKVSSGPTKVKNALKWLQGALRWINKGKFLKNRTACHKFSKPGLDETHTCVFYKTDLCPSSF